MICLGLTQSRFNVAAIIIFYTCILIPLRQLKEALLTIFGLVPSSCEQQQPISTLEPFYVDLTSLEPEGIISQKKQQQKHLEDLLLPLAVVRFGELEEEEAGGCCRVDEEGENEVCSICLVEFKKEDEVSRLTRCRHVFHPYCIKSWIHRSRFTCPLCRSFLLRSV